MVILYSTGCPKCTVLSRKLEQKNVKYEVCSNIDIMKEKGFMSLPILEVDGETMDFQTAIKWVKERD